MFWPFPLKNGCLVNKTRKIDKNSKDCPSSPRCPNAPHQTTWETETVTSSGTI